MPEGFTKLKQWAGINTTDPPTLIADNEVVQSRNSLAKDVGIMSPRSQQQVFGDIFTGVRGLSVTNALVDDAAEASLFHFLDSLGKAHVITWLPYTTQGVKSGTFLLSDENLKWNSNPSIFMPDKQNSMIQRTLGYPKKPTSLVYNNELYLFLGHTVPGLILGANDLSTITSGGNGPVFRQLGTTWAVFAGAIADQLPFSFGEIYKDIFVLGGLPPPYESLVFFTEGIDNGGLPQLAYYSLLTAAKTAAAGFGDGDKLLRVQTVPVTGGALAVEQYALMMKQRSIWLMQGDPPTTTDDGTLVVTPLMRKEGLIAPHAVCKTTDGIAWCSGRNVYLMQPGTQPRAIGYKIKGALEKLPQTPDERWSLEFHDDWLYLNTPSPGGITDGMDSANSELFTYLPSQQYWCDLRVPDEPKWWGPMDVRATHMLSYVQAQGVHQLVGITPRQRATTLLGSPVNVTEYVPFQMAVRGDNKARDISDSGNANGFAGGVQLPCSTMQDIRFREMDFGDDNLLKIIDALEVNASWDLALGAGVLPLIANDVPLTVSLLGDSGREKETANIPGRATQSTIVNPDYQTLFVTGDDSDNTPDYGPLALNAKVAQKLDFMCSAHGWNGGDITLTGTDLFGHALTEVVLQSALTNIGPAGVVTTTNYFRTVTHVQPAHDGSGTGILFQILGNSLAIVQDTKTDPAAVGFTLGMNTLGSGSLNPALLAKSFIPIAAFPSNGSRFTCYTFQPRVYGVQIADAVDQTNPNNLRTRHFWLKSLTPRVRPIGRRPGGSFGA